MASEIIVSNTTPLIALAWLDQLELLPTLFGAIHIPQAVYAEVHSNPAAMGARALVNPSWLKTMPVQDGLAVSLLLDQLDAGESEAIVLARELSAHLILMDERRGRRRALQAGLHVTGTLGILIQARHHGLVSPLAPILEQLQQLPFYFSENLRRQVLHQVGE